MVPGPHLGATLWPQYIATEFAVVSAVGLTLSVIQQQQASE